MKNFTAYNSRLLTSLGQKKIGRHYLTNW